ncbi:MAG: SulP family inorganic anion transporter [Gammaproteobacteria bacterium]
MAGLTGAVIVLPQGVAFAFIAGLPPEYGLYTAIVTPIVAALFGSSRHLISGPTTAISLVVFSAISRHAEPGTPEFIQLTLTLTFLAGAYQLGLGLARLGALVNFVSHTVVVGFTAGAAILIATSQLKHVLGIAIPRGESFLHTWVDIFRLWETINPGAVIISLLTLISALIIKRLMPRSPFMLVALVVGSLVAFAGGGQLRDIKLVGELPAHLPPLSHADFSLTTIRELASEAFAVALLGLIEAVSIARAIATRSGQRINGNQEFIGQGLSNIVGSFFSSYAGSGSFTRSGINYEAGAVTPLSAVFASLILAVILLTIAPLTAYLPIPAMAGIILLVAYRLIDWHHIRGIVKAGPEEGVILSVTFMATLFLELEFAIYAGVFLSLFFYLHRTTRPQVITLAPDPLSSRRRLTSTQRRGLAQCPQLKIVRIDGSIFFGAVNYVGEMLHRVRENSPESRYLLVVGDSINFIDLAGAELLAQEARQWRQRGGGLYICGLKRRARETLLRGGQLKTIGVLNFFLHKRDALRAILARMDLERCARCNARIFKECGEFPRPESSGSIRSAVSVDEKPQPITVDSPR